MLEPTNLLEKARAAERLAREARWAYIMSREFGRDMSDLFQSATKRAIEEWKAVERREGTSSNSVEK